MKRLPMIFPGQASQSVGMGRDLAEAGGPGAELLARVDGILGEALTTIMFEGPAQTLTATRHAQPAILAHSSAVMLELRERGVEPSVVAGHSLGEFSAAVAARALGFEDALRLVRLRGELMFAAGEDRPGAMSAVMGLPADQVERICEDISGRVGVVCVANYNSLDQVSISGEIAAVAVAAEALRAEGAKRIIPLQVSGAFHSPLLREAGLQFARALATVSLADPEVPLVANVSAMPLHDAEGLRDGFARQLTCAVRWQESLDALVKGRVTGTPPRLVLEVGPGKVLSNLARRAYPEVRFLAVSNCADLDLVAESLSTMDI